MMELSFEVEAFIYAVSYGLIAVALWQAGRPFPVFFGFLLLEIPYSFTRGLQFNRSVNLAMIGLSMLACAEGYWRAICREYERLPVLVACSSLAAIGAILTGSQLHLDLLTARHVCLVCSFVFLAVLAGLDWIKPLACTRAERLNLRCLAIWQTALCGASVTYDLYRAHPDALAIWKRIEWAFIGVLAILSVAYYFGLRRATR